jgi:dolichol-phosphate mannosyltransferase
MDGISIIIPIYNESENINSLFIKLNKLKLKEKKEIIFVDDNSNDGTHKLLNYLKKKYNIKFFIRKKKRDLMQSCFLGIDNAKYETCIIMDGDLQHDPKYIKTLYNKFKNNYDLGICVRNFSKIDNKELGYTRKISSILINFIINTIFKKKTNDPLSGFFIFKKKLFYENKIKYYQKGYKILLNLLYCSCYKIKVFDKCIKFNNRNKNTSKMNWRILFHLSKQIIYLFINNLLNRCLGLLKF